MKVKMTIDITPDPKEGQQEKTETVTINVETTAGFFDIIGVPLDLIGDAASGYAAKKGFKFESRERPFTGFPGE